MSEVADIVMEDDVECLRDLDSQRGRPKSFIREISPRRVFVDVAHSGTWIISDDRDCRGGRFRDREAAMRYIRTEFGAGAELTVRP